MIALELRLTRAALRSLARRPARRTLWLVALAAAFIASVIDLATASFAQRDLGGLRITPLLAIGCAGGIFAVAALCGAATPRPYGVRAADAIWWRYAGISRQHAVRGTGAILIGRVALSFGVVAFPLGAAFALAAPEHGPAIMTFAAAATCTAALARAIALAFTYESDVGRHRRTFGRASATLERLPPKVPSGLAAARWIIAVRRGEPVTPLWSFVWGIATGVLLALAATRLNGQLVSLGAVIGPLAFLLGSAFLRSTAVEDLRSPWWRLALGSRPRAVCAWAASAALPLALCLAGAAVGLDMELGTPLSGIIAIPTCALIASVLKLLALAIDVTFPDRLDRRGAATFARVAVIALVTAIVTTLAWSVASAGTGAMLVTADIALMLTTLLATRWISARL